MPTIKPFRTFVSPYGVTTKRFVYPHSGNKKCDTITHLDIPTIVRCYWLLAKITINYHYQINDFPIQNTVRLDATPFTLLERIALKDYGLHTEFSDDDLEITTECHFYPAQVFTTKSTLDWPQSVALQTLLTETSPLLWRPIERDLTETLSLRLDFKEAANNEDFSLTTSDWLDERHNNPLLDSYTATFLNSSVTFRLRTPCPKEIEGKIHKIEIRPEFFTVE